MKKISINELKKSFSPLHFEELTRIKGGTDGNEEGTAYTIYGPEVTIYGNGGGGTDTYYYGNYYNGNGGYDYNNPYGSSQNNSNTSSSGTYGSYGGGAGGSSTSTSSSSAISAVQAVMNDTNWDAWKDVGSMVVGSAEAVVGLLGEEFSLGVSTFLVIDGADRAAAAFHNFGVDIDNLNTNSKWAPNIGGQLGGAIGGEQGKLIGSMANDGITGFITGGPIQDGINAIEAKSIIKAVVSINNIQDGIITIHEYYHQAKESPLTPAPDPINPYQQPSLIGF